MKLLTNEKFQHLCRWTCVIISAFTSCITFFSMIGCETFVATCINATLSLLGLAGICLALHEWVTEEWNYPLLTFLYSKVKIVTSSTLFDVIQRGDVIIFFDKYYDGTSDTPTIRNSISWVIKGKGKKYAQVIEFRMNDQKEETLSLTKESYLKKFKTRFQLSNVIEIGDGKVIYSTI